MSTFIYLKNLLKDKNVASVTPSSPFCVKHVCEKIDFSKPNIIIEYGPGTGVFTKYLLSRMTPDSRLILIETNHNFIKELQKINDPRLEIYKDSVEKVSKLLGEKTPNFADYIISGIPFSFIDSNIKNEILELSKNLLKDSGKFLAYQTSNHLKELLSDCFGNVNVEFELLNIPPMIIYESIKVA